MNLIKTYHKLLLVILLSLWVYQAKAQTDSATYSPRQTYFWGGAHVGGGTYIINGGFEAAVLLHNKFIISAETDNNSNVLSHGSNGGANNYSALFGLKLTRQRYCNLMLLSGVSYTEIFQNLYTQEPATNGLWYYTITNRYIKTDVTVGIPLTLKYLIAPVNFMAFDFSASANINPSRTYFAITFGIEFGKVRNGASALPPKP